MSYTAIVIDDEQYAREIIREYMEGNEHIEIIGEYFDGFNGLKAIHRDEPDIIFLDIQMPRLSGLEMLELLDNRPEIIFTTAYDQYAIKAFEENAVDYLLKPFDQNRFDEAVGKALQRLTNYAHENKRQTAVDKFLEDSAEMLSRIVVKKRNEIRIIPVGEVIYLEADDDYVMVHLENDRYLKKKTLKYYENHLDPSAFIRVHRSFIVRTDQIRKIEPWEKSSHLLFLKNGMKIPVSRSGFSLLKERLDV